MFTPNLLSGTSREDIGMRSRIVVVDDEPDLRDAVAEYLTASGYDVTVAGDAAAMRSEERVLLEGLPPATYVAYAHRAVTAAVEHLLAQLPATKTAGE